MPSPLTVASAVRATATGRYAVEVDPTWSVGDRPNGGYLMALVARAAVDASPHPEPLTVSAQFLRPPSFGPAVVEVDHLRIGRNVGFHAVRLIEGDEVVLDARVSSGHSPVEPPSWTGVSPPSMPPPEECPRAKPEAPDGTVISLFDNVEARYDRSTMEWARRGATGPHDPILRAWLRTEDDDVSPYAVTVFSDTLPPTVFALGYRGWSPTVEMTTYLRAPAAPGWMQIEVRTQLVVGQWFDEQAVVWDAEGRVVAQARQLALVGRQGKGSERAAANNR